MSETFSDSGYDPDPDWKPFIGKTIAKVMGTDDNMTRVEFTDGSWLELRGWDDQTVFVDRSEVNK